MVASLRIYALVIGMGLLASGCTGGKETRGAVPISSVDKELSCEEIKLEINDAEFVKMKAKENRGLRARNILWPFGYPATYVSAQEAIDASNERINYLQQIYRIKDCGFALYEKL